AMKRLHLTAAAALVAASMFGPRLAHADSSGPDEPFQNAREPVRTESTLAVARSTQPLQSFVRGGERQSDVVAPATPASGVKQSDRTPSILDRFDTKLSN